MREPPELWEAHAGIFPAPGPGWEAARSYLDAGFAHVSLNVGFDLLDRDHALATARDWAGRIAASGWAQMSGSVAEVAAARAAEDAVVIDTSEMGIKTAVDTACAIVAQRLPLGT